MGRKIRREERKSVENKKSRNKFETNMQIRSENEAVEEWGYIRRREKESR